MHLYNAACVCVADLSQFIPVPVGVCVHAQHFQSCVCSYSQSDTWMTDDPVGDTSHPAQPESCYPPHPPTPLPIKKCALCLLPRLLAINPGSTSNVALPSFPQVTALNTIIIAASPLVCLRVCVCVCVRTNQPQPGCMHACLSLRMCACWGGGGGGLLDQRKPKSSYKRAMHSGWAEERREGDRRKERERAREREGEKS